MKKCPFCNNEIKLTSPYCLYLEDMNKFALLHHCPERKVSVMITGDTKAEIAKEWDLRYEE